MLRDEHLVCLSSLAWRGRQTSRHHLAREFARANDVLFVNAPTRATRAVVRPAGTGEPPRLQCLDPPPHLPVVNGVVSRATLPISRRLYERALVRVVGDLGWARPIVWNCSPLDFSWRAADLLEASVDVLHLTDAFWEYPGFGRDQSRHLRRSLARADLVVGSTEAICDGVARFGTPRRPPMLLRHGVDVHRFATSVHSAPPRDPKPVAGFIGRLDRRLDVSLIARVARGGVRVVLVGPSVLDASDARLLVDAGCEFVGEVSYAALAKQLATFDVAIVPYRLLPSVVASRPLKLLEYLAAGLGVVATDFPAARELAPDVVVAQDADAFTVAVKDSAAKERALDERSRAALRSERAARVRAESWAARAEELSVAIAQVR